MNKQLKWIGAPTGILAAGILAASLAGAGGCADTSAKRVETGGPETIRTVDSIDDQDWSEAATKLTKSMLTQDNLFMPHPDGGRVLLAVGRIINNSGQNVDTDLLTKQITVALNQSGKVITQTRDAQSRDQANMNSFMNDTGGVTPQPDYRLTGKLIGTRAQAGNILQATFYFHLSLTDKNGNDIWEGDQPITKIGSHSSVGI